VYAGWFSTDAIELAARRGKDRQYVANEIMVGSRSVIPTYEDPVTLAVNAARGLLTPATSRDIDLLIVATESALDFGKPISTWVHRFCKLPENCRNFEVKHACYGATAALKMALAWVRSNGENGSTKRALIISTDLTRPRLADNLDFIGGGSAIAMLVSANPQILEIDCHHAGYWSCEIADTFRPTARDEIADNQSSVYSYLDALEGALDHFETTIGTPVDEHLFKKHIYHAPFPGMTLQAHRCLLGRCGMTDAATVRQDFNAKVLQGLHVAKCIGTSYGASNFISLLSLLHCASDLAPGDRISLFAYGSGCQAEFYSGRIGETASERTRALDLDGYLACRRSLSVAEFEQNEEARWASIERRDYVPDRDEFGGAYDRFYRDKGLLVLNRVKDFRREYEWS
jgi:hydroxymethylglutaryl-CoA synthase